MEGGPGPPRGTGFYLQGVLIALGLRCAPDHVKAALEVAQDQATDDLLVGFLEQLLKQPQRSNADLGQEELASCPFLSSFSVCLGVAQPGTKSTPRMGYPFPGRFWGAWMGVGPGVRSLAVPSSSTN